MHGRRARESTGQGSSSGSKGFQEVRGVWDATGTVKVRLLPLWPEAYSLLLQTKLPEDLRPIVKELMSVNKYSDKLELSISKVKDEDDKRKEVETPD